MFPSRQSNFLSRVPRVVELKLPVKIRIGKDLRAISLESMDIWLSYSVEGGPGAIWNGGTNTLTPRSMIFRPYKCFTEFKMHVRLLIGHVCIIILNNKNEAS